MTPSMIRRALAAISLGLAVALPAASAAQGTDPQRPLWLRYPAVSPDGTRIAFSYVGQIWTVPVQGGEATPLTGAPFYSTNPVWSPDGTRIAFASNRYGNADVFVMPASGGPVQRLTYHSAADTPMAFSPDGATLYFSSARVGDPVADVLDSHMGLGPLVEQLYTVPSAGGRVRMVLPFPTLNLAPSADGKRILYTDHLGATENVWRKHQVSDVARDIWLFDTERNTHTRLTDWRGEDRNAVWSADGTAFLWLSELKGSFNVWRRPIQGGEPQQVTFHKQWPVRFLSTAQDGTLVYAWNGEIWRLAPGASEPKRVEVRIRQGNLIDGPAPLLVNTQATELAVSPSGTELAIIARGEVFVVSVATGATRRITSTAAAERFLSYGPDGRRLVYASERNGKWDIFEARLTRAQDKDFSGAAPYEEVALVDTDTDAFQPIYSPGGDRLAYRANRTIVRVLDVKSKATVEVQPKHAAYSYNDGDLSYAWSPDGGWLASMTGWRAEVEMVDAQGKIPRRNLSLNGYTDYAPDISRDGQIVLWLSDRNGLRASDTNAEQYDVYAAFLTHEAFDAYKALAEAPAPQVGGNSPGGATRANAGSLPDTAGLEHRTVRLTPFSAKYRFFKLTPDNKRLITVAEQPDGTTVGQLIELATHAPRQLFSRPTLPNAVFATDPGVTALYVLAGGGVTRVDLASGQQRPIAFKAEMVRDVRAEVASIFDSNWRATRETFYVPDMQGVDWKAVHDHYRRFVPHLLHWEDLAELQSEMVGELNASHQGSFYGAKSDTADATAALGLYYDQKHDGAGERIAAVLDGGPADRPASALKPGAVILAVDGETITPTSNMHRLLNRRAQQPVLLTVQPAGGGDPVAEAVTPITGREESQLVYSRWIERRRAIVERLSNGRIGYIHLRGMNVAVYQQAYGELFGRYPNAEALVVDVRSNGGGNLHDQLIVMLSGTNDSNWVNREGVVMLRNPRGRFTHPTALVVNASSYSDGSVFPTLYQQKKMGAVVGERVPGTGTAIVKPQQIEPNLVYGVPEIGFQLIDGRWFENLEVTPEILIYNTPASILAGRDVQLERAVEHLMKGL